MPTELANMILHHARYYHVLCAHTSAPHVVCDLGAPRTARPILSITIPRHEDEVVLDGVLRLEVTVRGHDEDWSGSPVDKDTKRSAWTWYSLGTADPRTHEEQLATNLHAVPQTQTHGPFVWGRDSPVMLRLKEDRQLELWAHAEYVEIFTSAILLCSLSVPRVGSRGGQITSSTQKCWSQAFLRNVKKVFRMPAWYDSESARPCGAERPESV